ncbi:MAG: ABC transporter permease, partial [Pseudomonadota bacterium]
LAGAIRRTPGLRAADYTSVGSQSMLQVQARQLGTDRPEEAYVARGLDDGFLAHTTYGFGALANGYGSAREVWHALRTTPGLAVVDSTVVPRRDNFGFEAAPPDFRVTGFYVDDGHFAPFDVEVRDEQTGVRQRLTVIGVLGDAVPYEMVGISTSQTTLMRSFPGRARPTIHYLTVAPGVDPDAAAQRLEAAFLPAGLEADSMQTIVDRMTGASRTFNRLIQGFMALGLVVGVAALGVISARAVVERRQQIGVMRAIGFRRGMVQAAFLLESAFVALTAILVGTALGLLLAFNIVDDQRQQPSWADLDLVVPWGSLLLIFSVVFGVALAATFAPAMRAARTSPAEALRYE